MSSDERLFIVMFQFHDKKKQNFACISNSRYCADRAQNLPVPAPNDVLRVLQILSKSVHFRRSYSQTREHRQLPHKVNQVFGRNLLAFELNNRPSYDLGVRCADLQ